MACDCRKEGSSDLLAGTSHTSSTRQTGVPASSSARIISMKLILRRLYCSNSLSVKPPFLPVSCTHTQVCVLVYKCLHQAAPTYLAELCSPMSESANRGHLRSAARGDLAVPRSRTTRYDQRCFAVSGPTLWNSLPLSVRDSSLTLTQFCSVRV